MYSNPLKRVPTGRERKGNRMGAVETKTRESPWITNDVSRPQKMRRIPMRKYFLVCEMWQIQTYLLNQDLT